MEKVTGVKVGKESGSNWLQLKYLIFQILQKHVTCEYIPSSVQDLEEAVQMCISEPSALLAAQGVCICYKKEVYLGLFFFLEIGGKKKSFRTNRNLIL